MHLLITYFQFKKLALPSRLDKTKELIN